MRVCGILLLLAGLAILACAVWLNEREKTFYATALRAEGRVIDVIAWHTRYRQGHTWAPKVEFTDTAGHIVRFVDRISSSESPRYLVGERVQIVYSPNDSERANIDSFSRRWELVFVSTVIGAFFLLIGAVYVITDRRQTTRLPGVTRGGER